MKRYRYSSPFGDMEFWLEDDKLTLLKFSSESFMPDFDNDFSIKIKKELDEYFIGKRKKFTLELEFLGTPFQNSVWRELLKIEYGKTKTYKNIACAINNPNAQRAVGSTCNKNPILIVVPCHRVISSSGKSGGYAFGENIKEKLLNLEGRFEQTTNLNFAPSNLLK